jgi:hypothetical protein
MARRARIYEDLEKRLATWLCADATEAVAIKGKRARRRDQVRQGGMFRAELPVVDAPTLYKEAGR